MTSAASTTYQKVLKALAPVFKKHGLTGSPSGAHYDNDYIRIYIGKGGPPYAQTEDSAKIHFNAGRIGQSAFRSSTITANNKTDIAKMAKKIDGKIAELINRAVKLKASRDAERQQEKLELDKIIYLGRNAGLTIDDRFVYEGDMTALAKLSNGQLRLSRVEIDEDITPEQFLAIAKILQSGKERPADAS